MPVCAESAEPRYGQEASWARKLPEVNVSRIARSGRFFFFHFSNSLLFFRRKFGKVLVFCARGISLLWRKSSPLFEARLETLALDGLHARAGQYPPVDVAGSPARSPSLFPAAQAFVARPWIVCSKGSEERDFNRFSGVDGNCYRGCAKKDEDGEYYSELLIHVSMSLSRNASMGTMSEQCRIDIDIGIRSIID